MPNGRRNTMIIFLVSGLWHGANWTFVIWGLYHALLFFPLMLFGQNRKHTNIVANRNLLPSIKEFIQMAITFFLVVLDGLYSVRKTLRKLGIIYSEWLQSFI